MRVCLVSHSAGNGGAEQVLLETIEILQSRGIECKVIVPERGQICEALDRLSVSYSIISFASWMSRGSISTLTCARRAASILFNTVVVAWRIYTWKCDIVYSNSISVCVGAFASRLLGRPHIWHLHEFGMQDQGLSFVFGETLSLKLVNRLSAHCICVSKVLAENYKGSIDSSKITVVYPSMHMAFRRAKEMDYQVSGTPRTGRFRCVIIGALIEGKGQEESVLAISELEKLGVDAELIIVGDGVPEYKIHLKKLVDEKSLGSKVFFAGHTQTALMTMRGSDTVLVCSRSEAFGRVTIEGMLCGKPVIGARSGASVELINGGTNGLLYTLGEPKDLATKIKFLYDNPSIAEGLGKNAASWVEKSFTEDRYASELLPVLNSVLNHGVSHVPS